MRSFLRKLKWLTERRGREAELCEELQFHLEEEADQRKAEGLAEDEDGANEDYEGGDGDSDEQHAGYGGVEFFVAGM